MLDFDAGDAAGVAMILMACLAPLPLVVMFVLNKFPDPFPPMIPRPLTRQEMLERQQAANAPRADPPVSWWERWGRLVRLAVAIAVLAPLYVVMLAGCASTDQPPGCALPELPPYDDATTAKAAAELAAAPEDCVICDWIVDYGRLRAQIRALRGE